MRIACVHIPQFALQTLTRVDPSLRGAAVAVVGSGVTETSPTGFDPSTSARARAALHTPVVHACSRAAWALGVRLGMTATAANGLDPNQLRVVTSEPVLERETIRAVADALLGVASVVDVGGRVGAGGAHLAMYCEVPSKTRGAAFGDRLGELLSALGLTARIGIADDRFTAWVAAAYGQPAKRVTDPHVAAANQQYGAAPLEEGGVVSVPRGGSAAFLSPRPLSLLAITPEVQHMLESLGVRTLGEFAALPAPSVSRPLEADYQGLARGESGQMLRAYAPGSPIREEIVLSPSVEHGVTTSAAVGLLAERIAVRLAGRARGAAKLEVTISSASGEHLVPITPGVTTRGDRAVPVSALVDGSVGRRVIETPNELADALALAISLGLEDDQAAPWRMRVAVTAEAIAGDELASAPAAANSNAASLDMLGVVLATTGSAADAAASGASWRLTPPNAGHGGHPSHAHERAIGHARTLRDERRDAHRRTQSGKVRRVRPTVPSAQVAMFADRK